MTSFGQLTTVAAISSLAIGASSIGIAVSAQNQINQLQTTAMTGPVSVEMYSIPVFQSKTSLAATDFFLEPTGIFSHPSGNQSIDFSTTGILDLKASAVLFNGNAPITSNASSVTPDTIALYATPNLLTPSSTLISDLVTQSDLNNYLLLNGTSLMTGNLQLGLHTITNNNGSIIDMSTPNHVNIVASSGLTVNGAALVVGPNSSTATALTRFTNSSGGLLENSTVLLSDTGVISSNSCTIDFSVLNTLNLTGTNVEANGSLIATVAMLTNFVTGPGSSTTSAVATYTNTTGKLIQNSTLLFSGNVLTCDGTSLDFSTSATLNVTTTTFEFNGSPIATSATLAAYALGPPSSTDTAVSLFSGTTGKQLANSTLLFSANVLSCNSSSINMNVISEINFVTTTLDWNGVSLVTTASLTNFVTGPVSSTLSAIPTYADTSGKLIQNSTLTFSANILSANGNQLDLSHGGEIRIAGLFLTSNMNCNNFSILQSGSMIPAATLLYDLGSTTESFNHLYVNTIVGPQPLQWDSSLNESEPLCPAGLRDLYQASSGTAPAGFLNFFNNVLYGTSAFTTDTIFSTDGGITYNNVLFTVAPTTSVIIGYNGSGLWVGIGNVTDPVYTSTDGIHFTDHPTQNISWISISIVFAFGLFIVQNSTSSTSSIATSPDGITWTLRTTPNVGSFGDVGTLAYDGSTTVVSALNSSQNCLLWSQDGITWNVASGSIPSANAGCATYSSDWKQFYVQNRNTNQGYVSNDGKTWTTETSSIGLTGAINTIWVGPPFNNYYQVTTDPTWGPDNILVGFTSNALSRAFQSTTISGTLSAPHGFMTILYLSFFNRFVIGTNDVNNLYAGNVRANDIQAVSNHIRTCNCPVDTALYSTFSTTNVNNTTTQTNISTVSSFLGTLTWQYQLAVGMIFFVDISLLLTSSAGDSLVITMFKDATALVNVTLTVPASSANASSQVGFKIMVSSTSNLFAFGTGTISGQAPILNTNLSTGFAPGNAITFAVKAQWGAAVNQLEMTHMNIRTSFANGA